MRSRLYRCLAHVHLGRMDKESHHLVTDHLVNDGPVWTERFHCNVIEAIQKRGKFRRSDLFGDGSRTTNICEENCNIDFRATGGKNGGSVITHIRIFT